MSFTQISIAPDTTLDQLLAKATQTLSSQGLEVRAQMVSPSAATMIVTKDRDGIKNFLGMGLECTVSLNVIGPGQVNVNTEAYWTNKILALVIGWFLCLIPFITGIIGCVNQADLPKKINSALTLAGASGGYGNGGFAPQAPYGQAPYGQAPQAPYNQPQNYQNNQQPPYNM